MRHCCCVMVSSPMSVLIQKKTLRGSCLPLEVDIVPGRGQLKLGASAHTEFVICDHTIDITYVRMTGGWMYLVAVLDWFSRFVVNWAVADTLELPFVLDTVRHALAQAT